MPPVMKAEIQQFQSVVESLIGQFETLREHLKLERELIRKRDAEGIADNSEKVATVLDRIKTIDGKRRALVQRVGVALNIPESQRDLATLGAALGGAEALGPLRDRLRESIAEADRANQDNQAAFKGVMGAMEAILKAVGRRASADHYNRVGAMNRTDNLSALFSKHL